MLPESEHMQQFKSQMQINKNTNDYCFNEVSKCCRLELNSFSYCNCSFSIFQNHC